MLTSKLLEDVRNGRIYYFSQPDFFSDVFSLFDRLFKESLGPDYKISAGFNGIDEVDFRIALSEVVTKLDRSKQLYDVVCRALRKGGVEGEYVLDITLDKSLRFYFNDRFHKNYGYSIHRDSWFDLAPDGVNIVFFLTDLPCQGNTRFFERFFSEEVEFDPKTRNVSRPEETLNPVTSYSCKSGDVLVFSGNHLHGGALVGVPRLSVEFRLSRTNIYGRPASGIFYRPLTDFDD
jgi:hypothetical protein